MCRRWHIPRRRSSGRTFAAKVHPQMVNLSLTYEYHGYIYALYAVHCWARLRDFQYVSTDGDTTNLVQNYKKSLQTVQWDKLHWQSTAGCQSAEVKHATVTHNLPTISDRQSTCSAWRCREWSFQSGFRLYSWTYYDCLLLLWNVVKSSHRNGSFPNIVL